MSYILIIVLVVLVIQILLFSSSKSGKQSNASNPSDLQHKYQIKTRADAWRLLNNPKLSEAEKIQIEDLYKSMK